LGHPKYKLASLDNILYTDTDSIFSTQALPNEYLGNKLGQMKLESVSNKAIFIAPKVYGLSLIDGTEIVKIKGSKPGHNVTVNYLESLLKLNETIELNQDKWFKHINESKINIESTVYTLKVTENKRQLVYVNDVFSKTNPLVLKNGQLVSPAVILTYTDEKSIVVYNPRMYAITLSKFQ
jgi:hypothetical protein